MRTPRLAMITAIVGIAISVWPARPAARVAAAGTLTVSADPVGVDGRELGTRITMDWTSDASGNVSGNTFSVRTGDLVAIAFRPSTGSTVPTDLYDITLVDSTGVDWLSGAGANLSATTASRFAFYPKLFHDAVQRFDLVVANAGNAKRGTVMLWVQ